MKPESELPPKSKLTSALGVLAKLLIGALCFVFLVMGALSLTFPRAMNPGHRAIMYLLLIVAAAAAALFCRSTRVYGIGALVSVGPLWLWAQLMMAASGA